MKKVTKPIQAVVFGSDLIATNWGKENNIPRENIALATQPDLVEDMVGPIIVVEVDESVWTPSTFPDENRVKDTKELIKEHGRSEEVRKIKLDNPNKPVQDE